MISDKNIMEFLHKNNIELGKVYTYNDMLPFKSQEEIDYEKYKSKK